MKKATRTDKPHMLQMLESAFCDVPGVNWVTGKGRDQAKKRRLLLDYSLELTFQQGEVWISDDGQATMLLFKWHQRKQSLYTIWLQCKIAFLVVGLRRLPEILARERYIQAQRPVKTPYIYCWFIACSPTRNSFESIKDLKDGLFRISAQEQLPIYMETTVPKMRAAYERYGFKTYHSWTRPQRNLQVWFFRRDPVPLESRLQPQHFVTQEEFA